jgi:hypothetical protein
MILEIRINGETLELGKDNVVSWERISPYFVYDDIFSDKVDIPAVPITSKNRAIFGFVDIVNLGSKHPRFTFEKYLNGQLIQEGTAFVSDITGDAYKLTVVQRLDEFFGDFHNTPLSEIALGEIALPTVLLPAITDVDGGTAAYLPVIINTDYYGDKGSEVSYTGVVNDYDAGLYLAGPKVPMPLVHYVLHKIGEVSGVTMTGDFFTDPFCQRLIHYNIRALDSDLAMILNRFVPDLTPPQYVLELRKLLNLSLDFNTVTKTLTIGFTDDIMSGSTTVDWSDRLVKEPRKIIERNRRLQLSMALDGGDSLMKDKPASLDDFLAPAFADDLGIAPVKTVFSTLLTDSETGLPTAKQAGSTIVFNMLPNRSTPRLLLWTGATVAGMDPEDNIPVALPYWEGKTLYWNGAGGLKETRWEKTETMRRNICYLDAELTLNEADLGRFDFKKKIHINGMDYLPLRISNSFPLRAATKALLVQV